MQGEAYLTLTLRGVQIDGDGDALKKALHIAHEIKNIMFISMH